MKEMYYGRSLAFSIMYTNKIEHIISRFDEIVSNISVNLDDILEELFAIFLEQADNLAITNEAKSNIYLFINHINRNYFGKQKSLGFYRDAIMDMLNGPNCDADMNEFYREQIRKRSAKKGNVSNNFIINNFKKVNESIAFESEVLYGHLDEGEDDFEKHMINFITSPYYTECLRSLMFDYPALVLNSTFKNRACLILEKRTKLGKEERKISLQKINSYIGNIAVRTDAKKLYKQIIGV